MNRPKHKVKELEALLAEAESKGWRVEKTTYYRLRCPCGEHQTWVHLTPSNPKVHTGEAAEASEDRMLVGRGDDCGDGAGAAVRRCWR